MQTMIPALILPLILGAPSAPLTPQGYATGYFCNLCPMPKVTLRIELNWNWNCDLDLHVLRPDGSWVYFSHRGDAERGALECDITRRDPDRGRTNCRGETESFFALGRPDREGGVTYHFAVHHFTGESPGPPVRWQAEVILFEERRYVCHGSFGGGVSWDLPQDPTTYLATGSPGDRFDNWSGVITIHVPSEPGTAVEIAGCDPVETALP